MTEDLFGGTVTVPPVRVLMSLDPQYYDLMWAGQKFHEFRRRFLTGKPCAWYVYLTAPASALTAVIDLDPAIVDTPEQIAALAEKARPGNGASVLSYLQSGARGFAIPITRVREYPPFTAGHLADLLGKFYPPQGYTLIDSHPALAAVCDRFTASPVVRETTISHR